MLHFARLANRQLNGNLTHERIATPMPMHTVTFDSNGGTGSMSNQSANVPTALTLNSFTRTGYSFSGWNTASNGSGTAYADGATYSFAANLTLYAQWTAVVITYTVTFDSQGGSAVPSQTVASGSPVNQPADPIKSDYTFGGWYTGTNFKTQWDFSNPVTRNITLYAKWIAQSYDTTVTLSGTKSARAGQKVTFTATVVVNGSTKVTPNGSVAFNEISLNGTPITPINLGTVDLIRGKATLTTTLATGTYVIQAVFTDGTTYNTSSSTTNLAVNIK